MGGGRDFSVLIEVVCDIDKSNLGIARRGETYLGWIWETGKTEMMHITVNSLKIFGSTWKGVSGVC